MKSHAQDLARIEKTLAPHICKPRTARSFDFRTPGTSAYAYSLTWTPGSLSLAGDCGELTIVHYHALWTLEDGLKWAARSDLSYLLDKTRLKRTFDRDATVREIIRACNEDAIRARKALRDEMRAWRRWRPDPYAWYDEGEDTFVDWLEARPDLDPTWTTYIQPRERYDYSSDEDRTVVAQGWEAWHHLREALGLVHDVGTIHKATWRKALADELDQVVDSEHAAYDMCWGKLDFCDYRAEYAWTFRDLLQVECIRRGAELALQQLDAEAPEPAYAWRPARADDMAAAFPSAFRERFTDVLRAAA